MALHVGKLLSISFIACSTWANAEPVTYFYSHLPPYEFTDAEGVPKGKGMVHTHGHHCRLDFLGNNVKNGR